ncbi:MAG: HNH endonuclease signature motif containing protein [Candidatus Paceibacterota bacterium]
MRAIAQFETTRSVGRWNLAEITSLSLITDVEVDRRVRESARHRCGYCLSPQRLVMARLEIEHIVPVSKGGTSDESKL